MSQPDKETLDRLTVRYAITIHVVVEAGLYDGPPDREALAELVMSRGVSCDDISDAEIISVELDEQVVAEAR